jgi:hypothetical protein
MGKSGKKGFDDTQYEFNLPLYQYLNVGFCGLKGTFLVVN